MMSFKQGESSPSPRKNPESLATPEPRVQVREVKFEDLSASDREALGRARHLAILAADAASWGGAGPTDGESQLVEPGDPSSADDCPF